MPSKLTVIIIIIIIIIRVNNTNSENIFRFKNLINLLISSGVTFGKEKQFI